MNLSTFKNLLFTQIPIALALFAFASADDLAELNGLVAEALKSKAAVLELKSRVYRIDKAWEINKIENLVIDGKGSTILYTSTNTFVMPIQIRSAKNAEIRNLTLDYEILPFTQGTVTSVLEGGRVLEIETHTGYPNLASNPKIAQMYLFDAKTREWKRGVADLYPEKTELLSATRARVTLQASIASTYPLHKAGDLFAIARRDSAAFAVYTSSNLILHRVVIHASPSLCFVIRYHSGGLRISECRVERGPRPSGSTEDRLLSSGADALNVAYLKSGMIVEGCDFGWMGDDSINIHGGVYPVKKSIGANEALILKRGDLDTLDRLIAPGDPVRFLEGATFRPIGESRIAEWETSSETSDVSPEEKTRAWPASQYAKIKLKEYRLKTTDAMPLKAWDWVEFPAINGDGYTVRGNYFHDHRARSVRIQAGRGLIENNRFERIAQAGLSIGPEYTYWREAGWAVDVTIRSNQFRDIGTGWNIFGPASYCPGAISIFYRPDKEVTQTPIGNKGIAILDNEIDGCSVAGIHVNASSDITIRGNLIRRANQVEGSNTGGDFGLRSSHAIVVQNSRNAKVSANRVESPGAFSKGEFDLSEVK